MNADDIRLQYFCPVCDGKLRQIRKVWMFSCDSCGLLASNLEPHIPDQIGSSVIDEESRQVGLMTVREQNNTRIIQKLRNYVHGPLKLLDVGSGPGFFLTAASEAGFIASGVEPDANVIARNQQKNVRQGYFPDALGSDEQFDVIVFNDVLEHIPDAMSAVRAAKQHLSSEGILVLNCPDRKGVFYRTAALLDRFGFSGAFDRLWQKDTPSPHRWYFTRDDLFEIGKRSGFEPLATVDLITLSGKGLFHRIFHLKGQSKFFSIIALLGAYALLPFLRILPSDLAVAIMRRRDLE